MAKVATLGIHRRFALSEFPGRPLAFFDPPPVYFFKSLILQVARVTRDQISELLLRKGVFPTRQRLDVGEVILSRPQHLSAEQIIAEMRKAGLVVSKATVYNTLNLFCDRGLLATVEVDPTRQFYDSTIEPHHHFYNLETGELIDIPEDSLKLEVNAPLPQGTEQAGVEVVIKVRGTARA